VVAEQLRRLAGIETEVVVAAVPGDDDGLGWRTRVRFAVDAAGRPGLHRHRSAELVPVDRCLIAAPGIDEMGVTRLDWPGVRSVEAIASAAGDRAVVVETPDVSTARARRRCPRGSRSSRRPAEHGRRRCGGAGWVRERAADREWRVSAGGFWQVHPGAADALVAEVVAALEPRAGDVVLDLYAGVGLFAGASGPLVGTAGTVVRSSRTSVRSPTRAATCTPPNESASCPATSSARCRPSAWRRPTWSSWTRRDRAPVGRSSPPSRRSSRDGSRTSRAIPQRSLATSPRSPGWGTPSRRSGDWTCSR
jgi:hypothetical protein